MSLQETLAKENQFRQEVLKTKAAPTMQQPTGAPGMLPTRWVRHKISGAVCIINASDFNTGIHEPAEEPAPTPASEPSPADSFGNESRDDLLTMSISALREKPEVKFAKELRPKATKDDVVDAILAVRASFGK